MKKQQVIVIHGGDTYDTYEQYIAGLRSIEMDLDRVRKVGWKGRLQQDLGEGFDIVLPRMPSSLNAKYIEWKIWMDKLLPHFDDNAIYIGHSLGGIFLVKYFEETKSPKKIKAVFMAAAPFDPRGADYSLADFVLPQSLQNFEKQAGDIYLYQSKDDTSVPFENVEIYRKLLPKATVRIFEDRGHFSQDAFPEVVKDIQDVAARA